MRDLQQEKNRAIFRNINARFPGFTEAFSNVFWDIIDKDNIFPDGDDFATLIKIKWKFNIDLSDNQNPLIDIQNSDNNDDLLRTWLEEIWKYNSYIDDIICGVTLIPENFPNLVDRQAENLSLQANNRNLQEEIIKINTENKKNKYRK